MSSISGIGSTLNAINQSLLDEIGTYTANKASASATATASSTSASTTDQVNFSQVSQLFQELQQIQSSDPTEFKQLATDAATKLNAAAQQQTDPNQAAFLSNLATKFQNAAQTGSFAPQTGAAHGHHHHHHHHTADSTSSSGTSTSGTSTSNTSSTSSTSASNIQDALLALFQRQIGIDQLGNYFRLPTS